MITRQQLDPRTVIISLKSRICPACGRPKGSGMSLCGGDYRSLPATLRQSLYARVGHGYENALFESLMFLGSQKFITELKE